MATFNIFLDFVFLLKIIVGIVFLILIVGLFMFVRTINSSFQKYLIIFALVIFIICLIIFGGLIQNFTSKSIKWPPDYTECPDYFDVVSSTDKGSVCNNRQNLGNSQCYGETDFTGDIFQGSTGICNKYKWANNCNVSWDGITYGVDNPCSS
jgi:hypothetical protein